MLNVLDQIVKTVLDSDWPASPLAPAKPGFYFTIPDEDWRTKVKAGMDQRLNIYLYEVRENVSMRRAEWDVIPAPAQSSPMLSRSPAYFDCHYLISAWSPSEDSEMTTPVEDEHALLAEALRIVMRNPDVNPAQLGIVGGGSVFQQAHIYLSVAPPEAPRVLNDFWSTMKLPWRPAIQLIATAPLDLLRDQALGPVVLTLVQRYIRMDATGNPEEAILIGGWVLQDSNSAPIIGATVQRIGGVTPNQQVLQEVTTDEQGRFVFSGLRGTSHTLKASAPAFADLLRTLDLATATSGDHVFRMS